MDKLKFHILFLDTAPSSELYLTVKNYMTRDGLSRVLVDDQFNIS